MLMAARDGLERFIPTRAAAAVCVAAALSVYGLESIAWPLSGGRDSTTYLMYFADMWHAHPAYVALMLYRTPLAPLLIGLPLRLAGPTLAEAVMAVAYALSVLLFARAALRFGSLSALATAVALLAYPGYGALFHQVSSDPIFALVYSLWTLVALEALCAPRTRTFALAGIVLLLLVLARPGAQVLLVFALAPLFLRTAWRHRFVLAGTFLGIAVALLALWAGYNGIRYGDFTVARFGSAQVPFLRVFEMEKLVSGQNGRASRQLAQAVERKLLPLPPYPRQGITSAPQFFRIGSDREWSDVVVLADREWGWASNYAILRSVALETIRRHPRLYVTDVARGVWDEVSQSYDWPAPRAAGTPAPPQPGEAAADAANVGGRYWWMASTPDGSPPAAARVARLHREVANLERDLPNRSGSREAARVLDGISDHYPWPVIWLATGLVVLVIRRPAGRFALFVIALIALGLIGATELGLPPALEYGLPFQPVFVLFAAAAASGRAAGPRRRRLGLRRVTRDQRTA